MKNPLESKLKEYALQGLVQIEHTASTGLWHAHWGCAVIAGALLIAENLVEAEAKHEIEALLRAISTEQKGFVPERARPRLAMEKGQFTGQLLAELAINADDPREIGHAVIYSAYVLKALDAFGIAPWASLLDRLLGLVRAINASGPGWMTINAANEPRAFHEAEAKTTADYWTIFARFDRPLPMELGDMQLGHLLTHGHAIHMMEPYAGSGLTAAFDHAYRRRLPELRRANLAQKDLTPLPHRKIDPRSRHYWRQVPKLGDMHGHALKYAYSFLALRGGNISSADFESYGRIVWPDQAAPIQIN